MHLPTTTIDDLLASIHGAELSHKEALKQLGAALEARAEHLGFAPERAAFLEAAEEDELFFRGYIELCRQEDIESPLGGGPALPFPLYNPHADVDTSMRNAWTGDVNPQHGRLWVDVAGMAGDFVAVVQTHEAYWTEDLREALAIETGTAYITRKTVEGGLKTCGMTLSELWRPAINETRRRVELARVAIAYAGVQGSEMEILADPAENPGGLTYEGRPGHSREATPLEDGADSFGDYVEEHYLQ